MRWLHFTKIVLKKKKKAKLQKSKLKATSSICETNDVLFSMTIIEKFEKKLNIGLISTYSRHFTDINRIINTWGDISDYGKK